MSTAGPDRSTTWVSPNRDADDRVVDLQYSDVKPAACAYLRSTRQAPEGSRMVELYRGEASDNGLAWSAEALDRGAPVVLDNQTLVSEVTSDCRWLDFRVVPVNGQVSMTWRDVTERHHTAERLAASEEKFRLLADNASDVAEKVRRRCARSRTTTVESPIARW